MKISLTICRQILFRNFRTRTIATPICTPAIAIPPIGKDGGAPCTPILSPGEEKVSQLSEILTIYLSIRRHAKVKASPGTEIVSPRSQKVSFGKGRRSTSSPIRSSPSPIQSPASKILSICLKIRSKFANRACTLLPTCTIAIVVVRTAIEGVRIAIAIVRVGEVGDRIGEEIVRICDNGGCIGKDLVRIGVAGDRICVQGDATCIVGGGKCVPEDPICVVGDRIWIAGDDICRLGGTIGEDGGGLNVHFVSICIPTLCHSEQKRRASE